MVDPKRAGQEDGQVLLEQQDLIKEKLARGHSRCIGLLGEQARGFSHPTNKSNLLIEARLKSRCRYLGLPLDDVYRFFWHAVRNGERI